MIENSKLTQSFLRYGSTFVESSWKLHASGNMGLGILEQLQPSALIDIQQCCLEVFQAKAYYQKVSKAGLNLGPTFQGIQKLWRCDRQALGWVQEPEQLTTAIAPVHLAYLDAYFQFMGASLPTDSVKSANDVYVPMCLGRVQLHSTLLGPLGLSHASFQTDNPVNWETFSRDCTLLNEEG